MLAWNRLNGSMAVGVIAGQPTNWVGGQLRGLWIHRELSDRSDLARLGIPGPGNRFLYLSCPESPCQHEIEVESGLFI